MVEAKSPASQPADAKPGSDPEAIEVELRIPAVAAILAWLIPGAGHFYQGRHGKGALFMICILSTWFFGLWLGGGHSVYASSKGGWASRLMFTAQAGVGLPAMPAVIQSVRVSRGQMPLWDGFMAPPNDIGTDDLSNWNLKYGAAYDMGILYTMIAGLLNFLAIYDAYGGPVVISPEEEKKNEEKKKKPPSEDDKKSPSKTS